MAYLTPHVMKPPKPFIPKHIVCFDTETSKTVSRLRKNTKRQDIEMTEEVTEHRLIFGYYSYWIWEEDIQEFRKVRGEFFETSEEFRKFIVNLVEETGDNIWVFAHNCAFDYRSTECYLLKDYGFSKSNICFMEPTRFIVQWRKPKGKNRYASLIFVDSMNYFDGTLKELGSKFSLDKLSTEVKMNLAKTDMTTYIKWYGKDLMYEYCKRDVEIVEKAMMWLMKTIYLDFHSKFAYTIAGLSFGIMKGYFPKPVNVHHNKEWTIMEKFSYYGGRTECFRIGMFNDKGYVCDVNSLYPSVMMGNLYPTEVLFDFKDPDIREIRRILKMSKQKKIVYIADVTVKINDPKLPIKHNGKLVFPIGTIRGIWASPELELLDSSEILSYNRIIVYKCEDIFTPYIKTLYDKRLIAKANKDKINDLLFKKLMNSSYGKTGQNVPEDIRAYELDRDDYFSGYEDLMDQKVRFVDGEAYIVGERKPSWDTFMALASFVTSYARAKMWKLIVTVGIENVYYMDTDSLFVNEVGYQNLIDAKTIDSKLLGYLDMEQEYDMIEVRTLKDYTLYQKDFIIGSGLVIKDKLKGVPKNATYLGLNKYRYVKFSGTKEAYSRYGMPRLTMKEIVKDIKRTYDKRIINEDGTTKPFKINMTKNPLGG